MRPSPPPSPDRDETRWVPLAIVARPHGIRGEIRLRPHNPDSDLLLEVSEVCLRMPSGEERVVSFEGVRRAHDALLVKLPGCDDRDAAEELRGAEVLVRRSDFPPLEDDEFYICDVIGARVMGPSGELGRVEAMQSYPTVEVFVVRAEGQESFEIPLLDGFVEQVDVEEGTVLVTAEAAERAFE